MHGKYQSHLDSARSLAGCLRAELRTVQAILTARHQLTSENEPLNRVALELTILEAYGFGMILGHFADQADRLESDLKAALGATEQKAG